MVHLLTTLTSSQRQKTENKDETETKTEIKAFINAFLYRSPRKQKKKRAQVN